MTRRHWLTTMTLALIALLAATGAGAAETVFLDDASIIIEINDTDGDAGIQLFLDGEGWDYMAVFDPNGKMVLDFGAGGSIGEQGITELFFESAEPSFDDQPLAELLALFPEGYYRFRGMTTEGDRLNGAAKLTHAIPDAPIIVFPPDGAEGVDPDDTVIEWIEVLDPPGSRMIGYQVIVERDEDDRSLKVFSVQIRRGLTSVLVPPAFMMQNTTYKVEILAIERSGNQIISENEFETGSRGGADDDDSDDDDDDDSDDSDDDDE